MNASDKKLSDIFKRDVTYHVPLYQRPYVWEEEKQLRPFLTDVLNVAETVLDQGEERNGTPPHFMGAIVLDPVEFGTGSIEQRLVVDGQQRLTTLQLFLAAAATVFEHEELPQYARRMRRFVDNDADLVDRPDERFKVWPTNVNREEFTQVVGGGMTEASIAGGGTRIHLAYAFFVTELREWLNQPESAYTHLQRSEALSSALHRHIELVVIDLEHGDDAQAIFETLNAGGEPLLSIDLVKNLVFQHARDTPGLDQDELYENHWKRLEGEWWMQPVTTGRLTRARAEVFLMHWLIMRTRREVIAERVFHTFRTHLNESDGSVMDIATALSRSADTYGDIDRATDDTPLGSLVRTLREFEQGTATPLIMWLQEQPSEVIDEAQRDIAYAALESYFARRALLRATSANYNRLVTSTIDACVKAAENGASVLDALLDRLDGEAVSTSFPDDRTLLRDLAVMEVYRKHKRKPLKFVLEQLERNLRTSRHEPFEATKLTVEHLLPQKWESSWPLDPNDLEETAAKRWSRLHRLGNLTLLTGSLNGYNSNDPWPSKRQKLEQYSLLVLSRRVCAHDAWTVEAIDDRSVELAAVLARRWESMDALRQRAAGSNAPITELDEIAKEVRDGLRQSAEVPPRSTDAGAGVVTTDTLISAGHLTVGSSLYGTTKGATHQALLAPGGDVSLKEGDGKPEALSAAAKRVTGWAVNGWTFWHTEHPLLGRVSLAQLREWYVEEGGNRADVTDDESEQP